MSKDKWSTSENSWREHNEIPIRKEKRIRNELKRNKIKNNRSGS